MNISPFITSPQFTRFISSFVVFIFFLFAVLIATGNFVPLQTSKVTEVGICLQEDILNIEAVIPPNTETLYICGILTGETKRSFSVTIFYKEEHAFYKFGNWPAGEFFIPVKASRLSHLESDVYLSGLYRIGVAYERSFVLESKFSVLDDSSQNSQ